MSSTVLFWRHDVCGVVSLILLCVGDGFANLFGRRFGTVKLPYNKRKSWAGSIAFMVSSFLAAYTYLLLFHSWRWLSIDPEAFVPKLALVTFVSAFVEGISTDLDNITVFGAAVLTLRTL